MPKLTQLDDGRQALEIDFRPSATAAAFIMDQTFLTGFFGPFGCGKTSAFCYKAWLYAQAFPGAKVGIFRATWPALRDTSMATFFEWFPPGIAGVYHKTDKIFELYTPGGSSFIYFRHLDTDQDISKCLSLELAAAGLDEPQGGLTTTGGIEPGISVNLYRALLGRVGRQREFLHPLVFMGGNCPSPDHWIANEFGYEGEGEPINPYPDKHLYLGTREDNVHNLTAGKGYYDRLERMWGRNTPMARRFLYGDWISFGVEKPFHRSWIRYWGREDEPGLPPPTFLDGQGNQRASLLIEAAFDPAISKNDTAARSALVVGARVRHPQNRGRILMLEGLAGHWSLWEQVDHILKAVVRWKVRLLRVEKVAYQAALKPLLDREARARGISLGVVLDPPEGDKVRRANGWSGLVEDGTILFAPDGATEDLVDSMVAVPSDASKWDLVDAAGMLVKGFGALEAAYDRLPGTETSTPELAESYAGTQSPQTARPKAGPDPWRPRVQADRERAKGYAPKRPGAPEPRRKGWR